MGPGNRSARNPLKHHQRASPFIESLGNLNIHYPGLCNQAQFIESSIVLLYPYYLIFNRTVRQHILRYVEFMEVSSENFTSRRICVAIDSP